LRLAPKNRSILVGYWRAPRNHQLTLAECEKACKHGFFFESKSLRHFGRPVLIQRLCHKMHCAADAGTHAQNAQVGPIYHRRIWFLCLSILVAGIAAGE